MFFNLRIRACVVVFINKKESMKVSIFSNSLGSFLKTKKFSNNETSLCVLLNVFLFSWYSAQTLLRSIQPTKTCYNFLRPRHFLKKNLKAPLKAAKSGKPFKCKRWTTLIGSERQLRCRWLVILPHVKIAQRYAILIGYIGFSQMWK